MACFASAACSGKPDVDELGITPGFPTHTAVSPAGSVLPGAKSLPLDIRFTHLGIAEGLSQSVVNCIIQDDQGFLWIGTQDGLSRYDGYDFKGFRPDPANANSISDRWVSSLVQDSKGILWIGTRMGGLNRYDPVSGIFTSFRHDPTNPNSLISDRVQVVYEDNREQLWIGTAQGLDRYSPARNGFEHYSILAPSPMEHSSDNITAIFEDSREILWIGTASAGVNRLDETSKTFINYSNSSGDPNSLSSNTVRAIQEDPDGRLWIATDKGLNSFDVVRGTFLRFQHSPDDPGSLADDSVRTIFIDRSNTLWIGTGYGLERFDRANQAFIHYRHDPGLETSLSNNTITAIYESSDDVFWVGTYGGGLNKYDRGQERFAFYHHQENNANSLSGDMVSGILIDPDNIVWISTLDGGLDQMDAKTGQVVHYLNDPAAAESLMSDNVWSVYMDHDGILWVGTGTGLDQLLPGATGFVHYLHDPTSVDSLVGSPVYAVLEDSGMNLWVGTEYGLDRFNRETGAFSHYQPEAGEATSLSGYEVVSLYQDSSGSLWVGTFNDGLNHFDLRKGVFQRYQNDPLDPFSISNNSILAIFQDSQDNLWIGTAGGGLNRYDPATDHFTRFLESDGLPNNVVHCIVEDMHGYLWLSTNHGISRFDPATSAFQNYTASDGLQGNEFNRSACARDAEGNLYFGGVNGLTLFDPEEITGDEYLPPVVLLEMSQDGKPVEMNATPEKVDEVIIRWPRNYFDFQYAALGFSQAEKNQYAYKLDNFDTNWNQVGSRREGRYTNIPGGTYTLRIIAANHDGMWNETGVAVKVTVIPPFWQTWLFRGMVALALLGLGFLGYRMRIRSVEAYNRELERQVRDRTEEIKQLFERNKELAVIEERSRLARELHDSAKQKAFAALAQLGTANGVLPRSPRTARTHLKEAENLVYEVIEELTFLIQEMYPLALKEKGLATTLREYVFEWENRTGIQADVVIENENRLRLELEQAVYRVIQESLSNVARHSRATHVEVGLSYNTREVKATISDNGCGFELNKKPAGVGLRSIRERIESLGGTVLIESMPDCGTHVSVQVPMRTRRKSGKGANHA